MRSTEITVFLVWDFGSEATQEDAPQLRAVDLDCDLAREHRDHLEQKGLKVLLESCSANHLFAEKCLGTLERIGNRTVL